MDEDGRHALQFLGAPVNNGSTVQVVKLTAEQGEGLLTATSNTGVVQPGTMVPIPPGKISWKRIGQCHVNVHFQSVTDRPARTSNYSICLACSFELLVPKCTPRRVILTNVL